MYYENVFMVKIKEIFGKFLLKILGWKMIGELPVENKFVAVVAPHTSIADMLIGKVYNWATNMQPTIMVKKEFFFFPLNYILKWWGSVPVDRQSPGGVIRQIANYFEQKEHMALVITPEGTRAANPNWKTGFYRIAKEAGVPIYLIFGDFKKKEVGYLGKVEITGDMEADIKAIKRKYIGISGYHPERFDLGNI